MGLEYGQRPGAGRLDRLQGCSPPWKMQGKRFRKIRIKFGFSYEISQHNNFQYFRYHFGSIFPRNPTKQLFRFFSNDAAYAMTFSAHLPLNLAISGLSSAQP